MELAEAEGIEVARPRVRAQVAEARGHPAPVDEGFGRGSGASIAERSNGQPPDLSGPICDSLHARLETAARDAANPKRATDRNRVPALPGCYPGVFLRAPDPG